MDLFIDTTVYDNKPLQIPAIPDNFIDMVFIDINNTDAFDLKEHAQSKCRLPMARSDIYHSNIKSVERLDKGNDTKIIYEIGLEILDEHRDFVPGDTIGILPINREKDVNFIIETLGYITDADRIFQLELKGTNKKALPIFIPPICTIRKALTECVDLHFYPKKILLAALAKYTTKPLEKRFLEILSSKEGTSIYTTHIIGKRNFLNILQYCPSCRIPFNVLLEHLPRLFPRQYSIASSPLTSKQMLKILISIQNPAGLTTEMLQKRCEQFLKNPNTSVCVSYYYRQNNGFKYEQNDGIRQTILIANGVGVAPFLGFLEHRAIQMEQNKLQKYHNFYWLFYGCRYKNGDYIHKDRFQHYLQENILSNLSESFSRDAESDMKYVQHQIVANEKDFVQTLMDPMCKMYVCGSKQMINDIFDTIKMCLINVNQCDDNVALELLKDYRKSGKYKEDIWM